MIVAMDQMQPCLTRTGAPRLPSTQADAASLTPAAHGPSRVADGAAAFGRAAALASLP